MRKWIKILTGNQLFEFGCDPIQSRGDVAGAETVTALSAESDGVRPVLIHAATEIEKNVNL